MQRFKINQDGSYSFYTFELNQKFNKDIWLENSGQFTKDGNDEFYEFYNVDGTPDVAKITEASGVIADAEAKQAKLDALAVLTITTSNGNKFDANDVARQDMLSAIDASATLGLTEQAWKMSDNSWVTITLAELKEASALAIQAKGAILSGV